MVERIEAGDFLERYDLPDWRVTFRSRIESWFLADGFGAAADFAAAVGGLADEHDHHPDIDLRYPGRVHVSLSTHSVGALTENDGRLAAAISALAAERGLTAEPGRAAVMEIGIDALDIPLVMPFWRAVLGYRDEGEHPDVSTALVDPLGVGPAVWFQQMDEPRPQRNRIHFDLTVPADEAQSRIDAALAAGGTLLEDRYARAFWVLADPEGNEICICTWQDRD